jgi:hypothetical protein
VNAQRRSPAKPFRSTESGTWPQPAPGESGVRPKTLPLAFRAGGVPRNMAPRRRDPRERGAEVLEQVRVAVGISYAELAEELGLRSDREGAEVCSGKIGVTYNELVENAPLRLFVPAFTVCLRRRLERERLVGNAEATRLLGFYLDTLERIAAKLSATT